MANRIRKPYVVTAKGRRYTYAWRGGPRITAPAGTAEYHQQIADAWSTSKQLDRGRFAAWITLYRASDDYGALASSTKRNWSPMLDQVKSHFGELRVRQFARPEIRQDIKAWRSKWRETPRMADLAKQVLSRVLSFLVDEGVIATNPCEGISNLYKNDRSEIIWTDDDLEALRAVASPEIYQAALLGALTGLRQGDLLRLPWSRVGALSIDLKTSKSRGRRSATIPVTSDLRKALETIPKRATTVLTNSSGQPWKTGFGSSWRAAVQRAGLAEKDLHFHDLRGTAATKFYVADFTSREIADILGWSPERVEQLLDRYVRRDELMLARIRRLERAENENRKTGRKTGSEE